MLNKRSSRIDDFIDMYTALPFVKGQWKTDEKRKRKTETIKIIFTIFDNET